MENRKKTILAGTLIASAILGGANLNASESSLFSYNELGSGSEVRTTLVSNSINAQAGILSFDMKCGADEKKSDKKEADSKSSEAKCGEGKCGEGSSEKKAQTTSDKKSESKSKDAKCGEGKCGN